MLLSQGRADAVKAYLVGRGIDGSRMISAGYGPDQPIETNRTAAGREKNRRVEFMILQQ
jgi:outer membrane protein OmpA-like peptidoglycan-associated protein